MKPNELARISSALGGTFAISWLVAWEYCYAYASRVPLEGRDGTFTTNYHGTILYLTKTEYMVLWGIPVVFVLIGVISAVIMKLRKPRQL